MSKTHTREEADIVAKILKQMFNFDNYNRPSWFTAIRLGIDYDGGYNISICIPSHDSIPENVRLAIPKIINGMYINFTVVTPSSYKKQDPIVVAEEKIKQNFSEEVIEE